MSEGVEVNTLNEYALSSGHNLPNHSTTQMGLGAFIKPGVPSIPIFRTKQQAYRFAAWLMLMAEVLPDEKVPSTFEEVCNAIKNT